MKILIVGCGMVGSAIAYELSKAGMAVTVAEQGIAGQKGASGASLGVLMAVCSAKAKGDLVKWRLASLQRFESLIPELEQALNVSIPYNRAGIICLYESASVKQKYLDLIDIRQQQGFQLEWWDSYDNCQCQGALYSPCDRWVHPQKLGEALTAAAEQQGVKFYYQTPINNLENYRQEFDFIVVSAGMGSNNLIAQTLLQPVRGLALELYLPELNLTHIIHTENLAGEDINIVPLGGDRYWLGATVEFNLDQFSPHQSIEWLLQEAVKFCPLFANAQIIKTWYGDRPRPKSMPAPIIKFLDSSQKIILATGHYRNGILMAPITAQLVQELILTSSR
ncbi:MAG: NAD(P)/FAD-dependent oxidoreductase [Pseudanabaenaceae cyanobacterium]